MVKNEMNHVSVSKWVFAQTVNCKFPLHKSMIELLHNFINSVVNPCSPDEFQEVPFAEKEISTLFIQPFDTAKCEKLFACQTLMLYYLQCRFKLSGQNEQNLNFQTRFSQLGLRLEKSEEDKSCLEFHQN